METNNKIYKTVLITVGILVVFSVMFINYFKLDEPVFFEHYFDIRPYNEGKYFEEMPFTLRYITNVDDSRTVIYVRFPEHPEALIQASEDEYMSGMHWGYGSTNYSNENYGRYSLRTVFCNIIDIPDSTYDDPMITKALIGFDDGSELSIDIGSLHLYKPGPRTDILESYYSSSSSDGVSEDGYNALEDITFESIDSPLLSEFYDRIVLDINDIEIVKARGMTFESEEQINFKTQLKSSEDIIKDYRLFGIHPKLIFSEENGNKHAIRILNINNMYNNDYSFMDLYRYIKERGEI